jgi:hypothetical protein
MEIVSTKAVRKKSFKQEPVHRRPALPPLGAPSARSPAALASSSAPGTPIAAAAVPCHTRRLPPPQVEQLQLERVIGLSAPSACTLSHNPAREGVVAYPAGSVVVLYDIVNKLQIKYLLSPGGGKLLNCTAFSRDGRFVAAGERGHAPFVLIWDVESGRCVQQLKAHKYGVASLSFSADGGCSRRGVWPAGAAARHHSAGLQRGAPGRAAGATPQPSNAAPAVAAPQASSW